MREKEKVGGADSAFAFCLHQASNEGCETKHTHTKKKKKKERKKDEADTGIPNVEELLHTKRTLALCGHVDDVAFKGRHYRQALGCLRHVWPRR